MNLTSWRGTGADGDGGGRTRRKRACAGAFKIGSVWQVQKPI